MKGIYRDIMTNRRGHILWHSRWRNNRIVAECGRLNAALMKGQPNIAGILYWAVGTGNENWDENLPSTGSGAKQLTNEIKRLPAAPGKIVYLNGAGNPTGAITNRLQVTAEFTREDFEQEHTPRLREFGLFGGNATTSPNSGFMIDHVIHPRIDMHPDLKLTRSLRLNFAETDGVSLGSIGIVSGLPIENIDGIGEKWANLLKTNGIHTLEELAVIDPLVPIGSIPGIKLREFCTKAGMVMGLAIDLSGFPGLGQYTISRLLLDQPGQLLSKITALGVTLDEVTELQHRLSVLQVALDEVALQGITLDQLKEAG